MRESQLKLNSLFLIYDFIERKRTVKFSFSAMFYKLFKKTENEMLIFGLSIQFFVTEN